MNKISELVNPTQTKHRRNKTENKTIIEAEAVCGLKSNSLISGDCFFFLENLFFVFIFNVSCFSSKDLIYCILQSSLLMVSSRRTNLHLFQTKFLLSSSERRNMPYTLQVTATVPLVYQAFQKTLMPSTSPPILPSKVALLIHLICILQFLSPRKQRVLVQQLHIYLFI